MSPSLKCGPVPEVKQCHPHDGVSWEVRVVPECNACHRYAVVHDHLWLHHHQGADGLAAYCNYMPVIQSLMKTCLECDQAGSRSGTDELRQVDGELEDEEGPAVVSGGRHMIAVLPPGQKGVLQASRTYSSVPRTHKAEISFLGEYDKIYLDLDLIWKILNIYLGQCQGLTFESATPHVASPRGRIECSRVCSRC